MLVKIDGELINFHGSLTMEQLKQKLKRPHLCSNCGVKACVGGRNLKNEVIRNAIKAKDGVYVLDCDNYSECERRIVEGENDIISNGSPLDCSIMHPNVRHTFII